jgi:hypothetical protein
MEVQSSTCPVTFLYYRVTILSCYKRIQINVLTNSSVFAFPNEYQIDFISNPTPGLAFYSFNNILSISLLLSCVQSSHRLLSNFFFVSDHRFSFQIVVVAKLDPTPCKSKALHQNVFSILRRKGGSSAGNDTFKAAWRWEF